MLRFDCENGHAATASFFVVLVGEDSSDSGNKLWKTYKDEIAKSPKVCKFEKGIDFVLKSLTTGIICGAIFLLTWHLRLYQNDSCKMKLTEEMGDYDAPKKFDILLCDVITKGRYAAGQNSHGGLLL